MKTTIINFSGRHGGNCYDVANLIKVALNECDVELFHMCDIKIAPCGYCNYECLDFADACVIDGDAAGIYTSLCNADIAYFILPNYIGWPNANFWVFNERKQGFFGRKPNLIDRYMQLDKKFVVISNTDKDNFCRVFSSHVKGEPDILFLSTKDFDAGGVRGGMMGSTKAQTTLKEFVKRCT